MERNDLGSRRCLAVGAPHQADIPAATATTTAGSNRKEEKGEDGERRGAMEGHWTLEPIPTD